MTYTEKQAAQHLGLSRYYLRNMRQGLHNHEGPPFEYGKGYHNGIQAFYKLTDLETWKSNHSFRPWKKGAKHV